MQFLKNVIEYTIVTVIHPSPHKTDQNTRCDPWNQADCTDNTAASELLVKKQRQYKTKYKLKSNAKYHPENRLPKCFPEQLIFKCRDVICKSDKRNVIRSSQIITLETHSNRINNRNEYYAQNDNQSRCYQ